MPKDDKNFKRLVRSRMTGTGESYVVARARLAKHPSPPTEIAATLPSEGDVLVLARGVPRSVRSLRVSANGSWDEHLRALAWDRMGRVAARRLEPDRSTRVHEWRASLQGWLELEESTWQNRMGVMPFAVSPARWREERVVVNRNSQASRTIDARSDLRTWQRENDGPIRLVGAGAGLELSRPWSTWTFDPAWWKSGGAIHPEKFVEVAGRPAVQVRVAGPIQLDYGMTSFGPADEHVLEIDLEHGLILGRTGFFEGRAFVRWEVTDLGINEGLSEVQFDPPGDVEIEVERAQRQPRQFNDDESLAAEAPFTVYVPTTLPATLRLRYRSLTPETYGMVAAYSFQAGPDLRTGLFQMIEQASNDEESRESAWDEVATERGTLLVSDAAPGSRNRAGRMTLHGTTIAFRGVIALGDLVALAGSLRAVEVR